MSATDFVIHGAPRSGGPVRPADVPEACWADRLVTIALTPMLSQCGRDAVREGLCADCYREIFGRSP